MLDDPNISEAIAWMRASVGASTDKELAAALGIDPTAISAWRRRKAIPKKYQIRFRRVVDEDAAWLSVNPSYYKLLHGYVFALIGIAAVKLEDIRFVGDDEYQEMWRGFRLHRLNEYLGHQLRQVPVGDKDKLRKAYELNRAKLNDDGLYAWIETLSDHD